MKVMTALSTGPNMTGMPTPHFSARKSGEGFASFLLDPLDEDQPDDDVVVTTRRAISRIALVASEVAGRFQRDGVAHDPMSWMMAPRTLFAGEAAVDACLDRAACMRGVLLHGLSLGLDAEPAAIDALASDDEDDEDEDDFIDFSGMEFETYDGAEIEPELGDGRALLPRSQSDGDMRLFTATVIGHDGLEIVQAFHASLAIDEAEIAGRLHVRMGAAMADAVIIEGFDPTEPLVMALVSTAICDMLSLIAADPASPLAAGIDLNIEQRFLA